MIQKFSKRETIGFGWETTKKNIKFFIPLLIFVWGILIGLEIINGLAFDISSGILSIIFTLGLIKISLIFCDNQNPKFSEIFSQYRLFFRYLFALILYNLTVLFGIILLIVPAIIFGIRFGFFGYFIVDKNSGIVESLKRSWQITRGNTFNLFLLYLLLSLINFLGALAFLIGLFWTYPTVMLAEAFVYRKLLSFSGDKGQNLTTQ